MLRQTTPSKDGSRRNSRDDARDEAQPGTQRKSTKVAMLLLQKDLLSHYQGLDFQNKLKKLLEKHGSADSVGFKKDRRDLVSPVQHSILPKYGYAGDISGAAQMAQAVNDYMGDPEISANVDAINRLLMLNVPEKKTHEQVKEKVKVTHEQVKEKVVELTREQVLNLQKELIQNYEHFFFQSKLSQALKKAGSRDSEDFRKGRAEIVAPVLQGLLPRYGIAGGASQMMSAVEPYMHDREISQNVEAINQLLMLSDTNEKESVPNQSVLFKGKGGYNR